MLFLVCLGLEGTAFNEHDPRSYSVDAATSQPHSPVHTWFYTLRSLSLLYRLASSLTICLNHLYLVSINLLLHIFVLCFFLSFVSFYFILSQCFLLSLVLSYTLSCTSISFLLYFFYFTPFSHVYSPVSYILISSTSSPPPPTPYHVPLNPSLTPFLVGRP